MTSPVRMASLVLYAHDLERVADFYRALGVPLEQEEHGDGPAHVATEIGDMHFAIYASPGRETQTAPAWRATGSDFPGFFVPSLDDVTRALAAGGTRLLEEHEPMPWGCRIVAEDPDGRAIEVIEYEHCPSS